MPRLPSGRHAGIDSAPLFQLIKDAEVGRFVHRLMAITEEAAILPYMEIMELLPTEGRGNVKFNPLSAPHPGEFMEKRTGVMADKIDSLGSEWSQDDIDALKRFLSEPRAVELRGKLFQKALERQNFIKTSGEFVARVQAWWWVAGVHPAQEENWADEDEQLADVRESLAKQHIAAGCDCEHQEDWTGAIEQYRKALALNVADPRVRYFGHNNLAYSFLQLGQYEEAEPHCLAAIEIRDEQYNAHKNLGLAREGLGRYVEAAISFINASSRAPGNTRAWLHLQKLLEQHPELPSESADIAEGMAEVQEYYAANGGEPRLN